MTNNLYVNKELYSEAVLKEAVLAYSNLASVEIIDRASHWKCVFKKCRFTTSLTIKEFENYLIGLSVQEGAGHVSM